MIAPRTQYCLMHTGRSLRPIEVKSFSAMKRECTLWKALRRFGCIKYEKHSYPTVIATTEKQEI